MAAHDGTVYRVCVRCVMDTSDPDITFDADGCCGHCRRAERLLRLLPASDDEAERRLANVVEKVNRLTTKDEYQCVVGLSGGVDSSYVALLAARLGLRVLAVHFDNGWNSEIAVANIQSICEKLAFDLRTYVIDWDEFRDLQRSFLRASVIDVELVTDHAIFAAMLRLARQHRIRFVLSGTNLATEAILPQAWVWPKQDLRNIRAIHRRFGEIPMKTFPVCGMLRWSVLRYTVLGPTYIELLNEVRYRKKEVLKTLEDEVGWRYYGGKHYESVFTRFYQAYLLPTKFGVDKRRAHLSSLIMNGEMDRSEALAELAEPLYAPEDLAEDRSYVLKKLGFSELEFAKILEMPPKRHDDYPSSVALFRILARYREVARERLLRRSAGTA
jgi:N-acetyl sugar amidotransferase